MSTDVEYFDVDKITDIIRNIVEDILNTNEFNWKSIDNWSRRIVNSCQQSLSEIQNLSKIIIMTMIIPKNDENIHMSNACLWDFSVDGSTIIK
jgi:hypothetical protein